MRLATPVALLSASLASTLAAASSNEVLVLGSKALVHESADAADTFSSAGLVQLAVNAFGVPTGTAAEVASPVQADVFHRVGAYAFVHANGASPSFLSEVEEHISNSAFHKRFAVDGDVQPSAALYAAAEVKSNYGDDIKLACVGGSSNCPYPMEEVVYDEASLQEALNLAPFLDQNNEVELAFAKELAAVIKATKEISHSVVAPLIFHSFSFPSLPQLPEDKRDDAQKVSAKLVSDFLNKMGHKFPEFGAQVVRTENAAAPLHADDIATYGRMLLTFEDLKENNTNLAVNGTSDITMEEIAEYQIVLWTSLVLAIALLLVILALCNLDTKRDSLLYANFPAAGGHRKSD